MATALGVKFTFSPYLQYPNTPKEKVVGYGVYFDPPDRDEFGAVAFEPSNNWAQAGPLLEQEGIGFQKMEGEHVFQAWRGTCIEYACWPEGSFYAEGPTPLVAAMRCLVLARLGDTVEVPEELT